MWLACICICVCAQACRSALGRSLSSFSPWTTRDEYFLFQHLFPIQPHPSLGTCNSSILVTGSCQSIHLSALAAAAAPQPPPLPTSGIALVPVRPMTEQQLVGGRENPVKPDSIQLAPSAQPLAGHRLSGTQSWAQPPSTPSAVPTLLAPGVGPSLGAVSLRLSHQQATPWPSVQRRGRGSGQSISGRAGARQQPSTGPWGLWRDEPFPPLSATPALPSPISPWAW